ncbi:MAG: V-type ATPase 116kDa subunit family protein [Steroidobacteraceae bacterium]
MALGAHFAWITGWCRGGAEAALRDALERAGVASLVHWPAPPAGLEPPVTLGNPRWARPFEVFVRLIGMPAAREADPSQMLALIAPLLFGFMFGDVGQGAVLLVLGLALQRRHPPLALLTSGGVASIAFGFAFGSVFGREDLVEPLWIRPLAEPLTLLAAALVLGVLLVGGGLLVDAASLLAAGLAREWLRERAGLLLGYAGGVLAAGAGLGMPGGTALAACGGVLAASGLLVTLAAPAVGQASGRRLATAAAAVGRLLEAALQLAVNTVSFLRVGAFALAHAGLSLAIVALAAAAPRGFASLLVLALGNAFVIVLEAAVAGIQTTRLVLFEFFSRFLRAGGRAFVALPSLELSLTDRRGEST